MGYTSFSYFIFVFVLMIVYYVFSKKVRWCVLLLGSILFYYSLIHKALQIGIFLLAIGIAWLAGIILDNHVKNQKLRKLILIVSIILIFVPFVIVRICGFSLLPLSLTDRINPIIPIGLSFFTLQLVAYVCDVYNKKISSQLNPFKFGLFASFFPQVIQGPIPRYDRLGKQLFDGNDYDLENIISGFQIIIYGFFLKYMIADKAAIVVNKIFDNHQAYMGGYVLFGVVLYSAQLYADFLGCTKLAQGVAMLFGIKLDNNFIRPFAATSVKDFWRRWHVTLGAWLRDYIYIPLGGSRNGKMRKYINLLITFSFSGIWHGVGVTYLVWGILQAFYQIVEDSLSQRKKINLFYGDTTIRIAKKIKVYILFLIGLIVFRAESILAAWNMFKSLFTCFNPWIFVDDSLLKLGLDWKDYTVLFVSIIVLAIISYFQELGVAIRVWINKQIFVFRWLIYVIAIVAIWVLGTYGYGYNAGDFIYGGF